MPMGPTQASVFVQLHLEDHVGDWRAFPLLHLPRYGADSRGHSNSSFCSEVRNVGTMLGSLLPSSSEVWWEYALRQLVGVLQEKVMFDWILLVSVI